MFAHKNFVLPTPKFDSHLISLILELDHLRSRTFSGTTPTELFSQLKNTFHILESITSNRIEGNNTTIAEYIDHIQEKPDITNEGVREIQNTKKARRCHHCG